MILVTVGTQYPFDRLVSAVDEWAGRTATRPEVLAQVGAGRADHPNIKCVRLLDGTRYAEAVESARLVVAHAGAGSVLAALDHGVPVIVMPRDHRRGEHRDDHQYQTARQLEKMGLVVVAWSEAELSDLIEHALSGSCRRPAARSGRGAELIQYLRSYLSEVLVEKAK